MKTFFLLFTACLISSVPAYADYNPASGEDELILISEAHEVKMGRSLAKSVEEQFGLLNDNEMQARVDAIGQSIAGVCDRPDLTYSFRVLEGKELEEEQRHNAFALPGGYVYIFKEMAEDCESDAELASILGHEVGHIVAKHSIKKLQNSIGMAGLSILGGMTANDRRTANKASPKTRAPLVNAVGSATAAMSIAAIARMIRVVWMTRASSNMLVSHA